MHTGSHTEISGIFPHWGFLSVMLTSIGIVLDAGKEVKQIKFAQFTCENKNLVDKMYIIFIKLRKFRRLNTLY